MFAPKKKKHSTIVTYKMFNQLPGSYDDFVLIHASITYMIW